VTKHPGSNERERDLSKVLIARTCPQCTDPQHPTKHGTVIQCIIATHLALQIHKNIKQLNFWIKWSLTPNTDSAPLFHTTYLPTHTHTQTQCLKLNYILNLVRTYTLSLLFSLSPPLSHTHTEQPVTDNMQHTGLNTTHRE